LKKSNVKLKKVFYTNSDSSDMPPIIMSSFGREHLSNALHKLFMDFGISALYERDEVDTEAWDTFCDVEYILVKYFVELINQYPMLLEEEVKSL